MRLTHLLSCGEEEIDGIVLSCAKRGKTTNPRNTTRSASLTRPPRRTRGPETPTGNEGTHTGTNVETQVKRQAERGGRETSVKRRIGCRNVLSRVTVGVGAVSRSHMSRGGEPSEFSPCDFYAVPMRHDHVHVPHPTPKPPQNPPTAPQGVPPIGRVACSVTNLSLIRELDETVTMVRGSPPARRRSLSERRRRQSVPCLRRT